MIYFKDWMIYTFYNGKVDDEIWFLPDQRGLEVDEQAHRPELVGQLQGRQGGAGQEPLQTENFLVTFAFVVVLNP